MTAQCLSESIGRNTVPWGRQVLAGPRIDRESGLAAADRTEDFDLNPGQRAEAEARYTELKASPRYAQRVQQLAAKGATMPASGQLPHPLPQLLPQLLPHPPPSPQPPSPPPLPQPVPPPLP